MTQIKNDLFDRILSSAYFDINNSHGLGGKQQFIKYITKNHPQISVNYVEEWFKQQYAYTLHKNVRRNIRRNRIFVSSKDEQWEADLVDMSEFSKENNGIKYILTIIDVLSKYLWAVPLKTKSANDVSKAFNDVFSVRKPIKLRTDRGLEFLNNKVRNICEKYNIRHFTSYDNKIKCSIVERVNRTLKEKMFRYFTAYGTRTYVNILPNLVSSYNNKIHRSIKMKPIEVTESNELIAHNNLYKNYNFRDKFFQNKKKTIENEKTVRKSYELNKFDKGYYPNWTDATFKISKIIQKPEENVFKLKDDLGIESKRSYYRDEIQEISPHTQYRIEKVIRKRKKGQNFEFLVKWVGYPNSFNSWVSNSELMLLNNR